MVLEKNVVHLVLVCGEAACRTAFWDKRSSSFGGKESHAAADAIFLALDYKVILRISMSRQKCNGFGTALVYLLHNLLDEKSKLILIKMYRSSIKWFYTSDRNY